MKIKLIIITLLTIGGVFLITTIVFATVFIPDQCSDYGDWDSSTSTCTLTQDLTEGIEIATDNIILDCDGHSITGANGPYGIQLNNKSGNTIRNCVISNFIYGINLYASSNNLLALNTTHHNIYEGIRLSSSPNNILESNITSNNQGGINLIEVSSKNTLRFNIASNNYGCGIALGSSSDNTLISNTADHNGSGIGLSFSSDNILTANIASNNRTGIPLYFSSNNILNSNIAKNNSGSGFQLHSSNDNTLTSNTANNNHVGIELLFSSLNNVFNSNMTSYNAFAGFRLDKSSSNKFTDNEVNNNGNIGFLLQSSSDNVLSSNIVSNNVGYGIYAYSLGIEAANQIYNNFFNNVNNTYFSGTIYSNIWNTEKQLGTNIVGGPYLGGNYWGKPDGTGFSDTCEDLDYDGICDEQYVINDLNIDYLPLTKIEYISAIVRIEPETLNLKSKGTFTAFIILQEDYNIEDIDISTVECEGAPAISGNPADSQFMVLKFMIQDLREDLPTGEAVEMTVFGKLKNGIPFQGSDIVKIIN